MKDRALDWFREDARRLGLSEREYARRFGFDLGMSERQERREISLSDVSAGVGAQPIEWGGGCDHPVLRREEWRPGIYRWFCTVCETFVAKKEPPGEAGGFELREAA